MISAVKIGIYGPGYRAVVHPRTAEFRRVSHDSVDKLAY